MNKKSFIMYFDTRAAFDALDNESAGELIKAVFAFQAGEEVTLSPAVAPIFAMLRAQLVRDAEKYQAICRARAEAGRAGGRQKAANAGLGKQKSAIASNCQQVPAQAGKTWQNLPDSDSDSDSDSEINKESILKDTKENGQLPLFEEPPVPQVEAAGNGKSFKQWTLEEFKADVNRYPEYSAIAVAFSEYWTEKSASGKMRFQLEKTWETDKRLGNWQRRNAAWNKGGSAEGKEKDYSGL